MRYNIYDRNTKNILGEQTTLAEKKLLIAVLKRAVLDYLGGSRSESVDARSWIFSGGRNGRVPEFSFAWVCEQLCFDLERTRDQIKELEEYSDNSKALSRFRSVR